jgi:hypothetical protein
MSSKRLFTPIALFFLLSLFLTDAFSWPGSNNSYSRRYDNFSRSSSEYSEVGNDFSGGGSGNAGFESIDVNAELFTFRFSGTGRTKGDDSSNESNDRTESVRSTVSSEGEKK